MKYELNDKPGILPMLMYGLQWWIVSLPCVVIMGIIVSQLHYTDVAEQTFYLQKLFGIMGIAMIVQVLWGHRLPLIIGPASVLLIGILFTVSSGIPAVYTGIMVGGLVLTVLAYSGLLGKLQFRVYASYRYGDLDFDRFHADTGDLETGVGRCGTYLV